ncbi:hypothetical protein RHMOL_Rhmol04G0286500 [Rhododendron molle]|uniref:Uncharacterized protein n=1 Tax=Rhododendron molle TaxID=49168 RepID=A0ACC0P720_RHOML|nr:hypothetical protein RHMOL_Rhmol04G0286500 [Rhododendron molle]
MLPTGAEFKWKFRINFFETTLFFCHFYWGSKDKSFVTYDKNIDLKYCLHIISRIPNELLLRCQSADDDLGNHTLSTGEEFKWNFHPNFFGTTLFFCHFYWGSKDKSVVTYDNNIDWKYCHETSNYYNCYWEARPDGFYASGDQKSWKLLNKWT